MYLCNHVQFTCRAVILHIKDMLWRTERSLCSHFLGNLSEEYYLHIFSVENILIIFLKNMVNIMIVEFYN